MDLVQLDIAAIKQSDSQNNAYVLLLNETTGDRQLPIVIGWCEARSIAIALDGNEEPERPLTHDLFKTFSNSFEISVSKIIIHTLNEGVFHASFFCKSKLIKDEIEIDARTSDAIALAIRFSCPIFTYEDILKRAGIIVKGARKKDDEDAIEQQTPPKSTKKEKGLKGNSIAELNELLNNAIEAEDYEKASEIRDEINSRKKD